MTNKKDSTSYLTLFWALIVIVGIAYKLTDIKTRNASAHKNAAKTPQSIQQVTSPANPIKTKKRSVVVATSETTSLIAPPKREAYESVGLFGRELYPSLLLAWSNYSEPSKKAGGENLHFGRIAHVGVIISNPEKNASYRLNLKADRFIKETSCTVSTPVDLNRLDAAPQTIFDYYELARLRQTISFNLSLTLYKDEKEVWRRDEVWVAHQINDCPVYLPNNSIGGIKNIDPALWKYTFSGFVNENHPWIDSLLAEALALEECKSFSGYNGDQHEIIAQLKAVWRALQNRGVRYSSISTSTGGLSPTSSSTSSHFQHVRFIEDTLSNSQANCIDGTVLLASIFRKIGFRPVIFLVPGHAYVGIKFADNSNILPIETTMISSHRFLNAVEYALESGKWSWQKISQMSADQQRQNGVMIIDIAESRSFGIQPIPYLGKDGLISSSLPKNHRQVIRSQFENVSAEADRRGMSAASVEMERYAEFQKEKSFQELGPVLQEQIAKMKARAEQPYDPINKDMQFQRKRIASQNLQTLESGLSHIRFTDAAPGERVLSTIHAAYQEVKKHQEAFNSMPRPPVLISTGNTITDAQLQDIYADCRTKLTQIKLKASGPYLPDDLERAVEVSKLLQKIADLPLNF